jgi:hypothetical protein
MGQETVTGKQVRDALEELEYVLGDYFGDDTSHWPKSLRGAGTEAQRVLAAKVKPDAPPFAIPPSCEGLGWSHGGW